MLPLFFLTRRRAFAGNKIVRGCWECRHCCFMDSQREHYHFCEESGKVLVHRWWVPEHCGKRIK
jgi:hypothetical protein